MHPTPISAAFFFLASGVSAYLLSGVIVLSGWKTVRVLSALTLWETFQLIPVHLFATLQMLGWVARVTVPQLAAIEAAVLAAVAIWVFLRKRSTPAVPNPPRDHRPLPAYLFVASAVLLGSYLAFAANAFTGSPEGSDALIYHLPLALRWLQDGSLAIPASRVWQYGMPANAEIGMMVLLSSGRAFATMMASWIPAGMVTISTYLLAMWISKGNRLASLTACLIVLSIPMIEFQTFSAYVDLLGTAGILAAFAMILSASGNQPESNASALSPVVIFLSGLACGISVGTKPIYYFYAAVFCLFMAGIFWMHRSLGKRALLKSVLLLGLGLLLPSCFWFGRAAVQTGNPLYPIQVKVGERVIFPGYRPSQITQPDFELNEVREEREWLLYPWTEWKRDPGYLQVPYGEGSGLGAVFATFVPLGILFFFLQAWVLKHDLRRNGILLLFLVGLGLSWWAVMERMLRFGQAILVFACVLSVPLIVALQSTRRRGLAILLVSSVVATSAVCASVPLHLMAGRFRKHRQSTSQTPGFPKLLNELPDGSVVLNASGSAEKNFGLAGDRLSNRVIAGFEAPVALSAQSLQATGADYVVEVIPGGIYPMADLVGSGARLVDDEFLTSGKDQIHWRIWRVEKKRAELSGSED